MPSLWSFSPFTRCNPSVGRWVSVYRWGTEVPKELPVS